MSSNGIFSVCRLQRHSLAPTLAVISVKVIWMFVITDRRYSNRNSYLEMFRVAKEKGRTQRIRRVEVHP